MASSKVKYGLTNVYYSVLTPGENADTYAAPVRIPGAVSMSMEAQGDLSKFYADNGVYWQAASNQGYEGDWEFAKLPEDFRTAVLGEVLLHRVVLYMFLLLNCHGSLISCAHCKRREIIIRIPVIPGYNMSDEEMQQIAGFLKGIRHSKVELLGYHKLGENKYAAIDKDVTKYSVPSAEEIKRLEELFF